MICFRCKKPATYKIKTSKERVSFCDYCYYRKKYRHPEKEMIVLSHLSTKQGVNDRHKAIEEYLLPEIEMFMSKKRVYDFKDGIDCLIDAINPKLKEFLLKNKISIYEFLTCLRMIDEKL